MIDKQNIVKALALHTYLTMEEVDQDFEQLSKTLLYKKIEAKLIKDELTDRVLKLFLIEIKNNIKNIIWKFNPFSKQKRFN